MKWTEKIYRQKIRQMKEQISDEEIFLSEQYQELLRKMSAQITQDHFRNVHIYRDDEPESAGWCDGNMVGINIDNILTQSFYNKELKNKSLVGILGHECGHKNYSNSYLREKYLDGILKEHKFYPHSPVPEAEGEKECLEALKECFQNEEHTVIRLVYKTAAYLNNLLEDVYVEEKMCRNYPGSIRQGIQMNRSRHADLIISLKKQMEMGRARTEIILNVITQYTLSGSVNDWEGVGQEYTECLDVCIPVINGAVKAVQESARFEATNQILLKIWKFIKADADDVEKSRQKGREAECGQLEQNPEKEPAAGTSEPNRVEESVSEPSEQNLGERAESSQLDQSQKEETEGESSERDQDEKPEQEQSERPEDELPEHNQGDESECNQREEPKCRNTEQNRDQELECEDSEQNQEEHSECEASKPKKHSDCGEQQSSETPEKSQKEQDSPDSIDSGYQEQSQEEKNSQGNQSETQPGNSKAQASDQRQGFTEDDPERTEQLIDELLSQLSSYSGDYISGQTGGEAQDIPWDGAWNPKKQNEAEDHAASESSSHETSETNSDDGNGTIKTSGGDSDETTETSGNHGDESEKQKSPDCTAEPDFEERVQNNQAETENEIGALIYNMAKERVDMQFEEELQNALREQMDQIEFGYEHAKVEKRLIRSVEISEEAVSRYKEMEQQMRQVMKRLKTQVLPFLEKRQTRMEKGMPMGRRMDHRTVYRPDRKVFQRRSLPSEEQDAVMSVLIDLSGSMRMDDRINYAVIAALCLYQFGQEAGIPTSVYGHHTDISWDWKKETVCIHSFAEFDSMDGKDKYRIMDAKSCGANRDGVAVRYMGEMLLARPEKQKLLILISDGLPNGIDYSGIVAKKDLRRVKADLTRRGVIFLAAAIGDDKAAIQDIYEEAFLDISDLKKLPEKLAKQVLKKIS